MNKLQFSILFFLLFTKVMFSQNNQAKDTIYLDENEKVISKKILNNKLNTSIFYFQTFEVNKQIVTKLSYNFYFGKLTKDQFNSIQKSIVKPDQKITENLAAFIYYKDTLYGYEASKIRKIKHDATVEKQFQKKNTNHVYKGTDYTTKIHQKRIRSNNQKLTKCAKKFQKKTNAKTYYSYTAKKEYNNNELDWTQDNGTVQELFKKNKIYRHHNRLLLIHPDGSYFICSGRISDEVLIKILKTEDWTQFNIDFKNSILSSKNLGVIDTIFLGDIVFKENCY